MSWLSVAIEMQFAARQDRLFWVNLVQINTPHALGFSPQALNFDCRVAIYLLELGSGKDVVALLSLLVFEVEALKYELAECDRVQDGLGI